VEVWLQAPNPDNKLQPGTSVHVDIVARVVPNAIVVPLTAILTDSSGAKSVMMVTPEHQAKRQDVITGIENGGLVQILKGVESGQFVIATGAYGLPDGTKVNPSQSSSSGQSGSRP
jgi:HlyD family secretion protein